MDNSQKEKQLKEILPTVEEISNELHLSSQEKEVITSKIDPNYWQDNMVQPYDAREAAFQASDDCKENFPGLWIMTSTPEPLRAIFTAIRTCYSPHDQAYIAYEEYFKYLNRESKDNEFPNDLIRLLSQVAKMRHLSTLEHVTFTFGIRCVSRVTLAQLTRHRIGWSYSVQSQRYVKQSEGSKHGVFNYIIPPEIASNPELTKIYNTQMESAQLTYNQLVDAGIKPEDARYVFPNSATTNITVTANLRAFLDFYEKRNEATHSQWEIQRLAEKMKCEILKVEPGLNFLFNGSQNES